MKRTLNLFSTTNQYQLPLPGHREKWISGLGGALGIALTILISQLAPGHHAILLVASMGASAVLLFAVPHSAFSTPYAVLVGHTISAVVGIACAWLIPSTAVAAPLAVGLAIICMYYLHSIHPPGGATAFFAVMGGPAVHAMGFEYVLFPVLLNASTLVIVAMIFNHLLRAKQAAHVAEVESHLHLPEKYLIRHSDLVYALSEIQSYIDVSEEDLLHIYNLAIKHAHPGEAQAA
jgi:CBS domain-containing membrane protein